MPIVKNDLKLSVNRQFIAPSLYNQITQLIFITDIFRPRIKCTTLFGGALYLYEVRRFLSKFFSNHAAAAETIFVGLPGRRSLSPRVSPSRAPALSCAHNFQAPTTQAAVKWSIERDVATAVVNTQICWCLLNFYNTNRTLAQNSEKLAKGLLFPRKL